MSRQGFAVAALLALSACAFESPSESVIAVPSLALSASGGVLMSVQSGDGQVAPISAQVSELPAVLLTRDGHGVAAVPVVFTVTGGGGSVTGAVAITDAGGVASPGSWRVGSVTGINTLRADALDKRGKVIGSVLFTAQASADGFHFEQEYDGARATAGVPWNFREHLKVLVVNNTTGHVVKYVHYWVTNIGGGCGFTAAVIVCPAAGASVQVDFQQGSFDGIDNPAWRPGITLQVN